MIRHSLCYVVAWKLLIMHTIVFDEWANSRNNCEKYVLLLMLLHYSTIVDVNVCVKQKHADLLRIYRDT